jgi:parvulin-like peptidyl-prolyl isomerase
MAFCAAIATAVCLGACGSGLPGNAVVQIGQASISTAALDHWLTVANDTSQVSNGTKAPALPLPPNFTACVRAQQQSAGNTAQSHTAGEIATYKATCQQNYATLVTEVLNYLIPRLWVEGEAASRGIHVTKKQIEQAYEQELKTSNPSLKAPAQLRHFLAASGQTVEDLKWLTTVNLLVNKIELQVQHQAGKVTPKDISAYYDSHRSQYETPETRDLHLVLTSSPATAQKVHNLLSSGQSYSSVASQYSVDSTSKANGGAMLGVSTAELTPQLSTKVFAAKPGVLSAPVKTPFGYYVFTVDKVTPAKVQSLKDASASIKALLSQQRVSAAEGAFQSDFTKKWAAETNCREGYQVATYCSNPPKGSTTATGSTGGTG